MMQLFKLIKCLCGDAKNAQDMKQCTTCHTYQHSACIGEAALIPRLYECPKCQLQKMDPTLEVIENIFSCLIIKPSNDSPLKLSSPFTIKTSIDQKIKKMLE